MSDARAGRGSQGAFRFVLLIGILSFFADCTYEGGRSILGQFLASLGTSATSVGIITGAGELFGYGLRLLSGRLADSSGRFWPIMICGYILQMASVPALALARNWLTAAVLVLLERIGKAIRNPPRDVMLSYAAERLGGYGWVFGLHEAFDQAGALTGPLLAAAILARHGTFREIFGILLIPAVVNIGLVGIARAVYPRPQDLALKVPAISRRLPAHYWIYLIAASFVAAGFADFPLITFHLTTSHQGSAEWGAIFYAVAMGISGLGSIIFGRLYDRRGFTILIILTAFSAFFAPLVFLGNFWMALTGSVLWGLGLGVHETIIPAAITPLVPANQRASAFGFFTAVYGISWFFGSAIIGVLYDFHLWAAVAFCMSMQFLALPILWWVKNQMERV